VRERQILMDRERITYAAQKAGSEAKAGEVK
jgi:hypothetical protein